MAGGRPRWMAGARAGWGGSLSTTKSFFDELQGEWKEARKRVGGADSDLLVGGRPVRLRFAGSTLPPLLLPALEHLVSTGAYPTGTPSLTVSLWDTATSGVRPPPPPPEASAFVARGEVRHHMGDRLQLSFSVDSGALHAYDPGTARAVLWIRDPAKTPAWERAAPLRPLFGWWAEEFGAQLVHGAVVGDHRGGILLAAPGGSGKSTTALACLDAGMLYAGDDYVLAESNPDPIVHTLFGTAKLVPAHLRARLPRLVESIEEMGRVDQEKVVLLLRRTHPDQLVSSLPLRAILVPTLHPEGEIGVEEISPARTLAALAPTTLFQLPGAGGRAFETMSRLVRQVPTFRLRLGPDLDRVVAEIGALLESLAPSEAHHV